MQAHKKITAPGMIAHLEKVCAYIYLICIEGCCRHAEKMPVGRTGCPHQKYAKKLWSRKHTEKEDRRRGLRRLVRKRILTVENKAIVRSRQSKGRRSRRRVENRSKKRNHSKKYLSNSGRGRGRTVPMHRDTGGAGGKLKPHFSKGFYI